VDAIKNVITLSKRNWQTPLRPLLRISCPDFPAQSLFVRWQLPSRINTGDIAAKGRLLAGRGDRGNNPNPGHEVSRPRTFRDCLWWGFSRLHGFSMAVWGRRCIVESMPQILF
jgi:hypothetical protein